MKVGDKKVLLIGKMDLTEPGIVSKLQPKVKHYCINISSTSPSEDQVVLQSSPSRSLCLSTCLDWAHKPHRLILKIITWLQTITSVLFCLTLWVTVIRIRFLFLWVSSVFTISRLRERSCVAAALHRCKKCSRLSATSKWEAKIWTHLQLFMEGFNEEWNFSHAGVPW